MAQTSMFRVNQLAKDLGMKSKELLGVLEKTGVGAKTTMAVLEADEINLLFDELTREKQIKNLDRYLDGSFYIRSETELAKIAEKAAAEKAAAEKAAAEKAAAEKAAVEKAAAEKAAAEKAAAEKAAAEKAAAEKAAAEKAAAKQQIPQAQTSKPQYQNKTMQDNRNQFQNRQNQDNRNQFQNRQNQDSRNQFQNRTAQDGRNQFQNRQNQDGRNQFQTRTAQDGRNQFQNRQPQDPRNAAMAKPNQNTQTRPQNPPQPQQQNQRRRTGGTRVVDTRSTAVDLSKYDERLDNIAPDVIPESQALKQKLKKQNTRDARGARPKDKEAIAMEKLRRANLEKAKKQQLSITIPDEISVSELASRLKVTAAEVIKRLMMLGMIASVNQIIDYDTAYLVADELGAKVTREVVVTIEDKLFDTSEDSEDNLKSRAPVVCVMGHVDHGKTSLLDAIRHTKVTAGEAGGITQHIGAYTVNAGGRDITFLDTPGHAAFTAMRARGAKSTDIAILVVAADDGIMPQTVEAINHAKAAGIDIVVAINKMDKPTANPDAIKSDLTKYDLVPEEWGGDTICVPVSALTGKGIDDLLESVLLVADMRELKANPDRRAKGIVIEAKLDRGRGPVATVLVQNGTLHVGDVVIAGESVGRVRAMIDDKGKSIKTAGPSIPVEITGLGEVPQAGDELNAVEDERMARELADQRHAKAKEAQFSSNQRINLNDLFAQINEGVKELNIIVKADVGGSAEAVKEALEKLTNEEVRVRVIHSAVGGITEGDVLLASASNALIVGFNVRPDRNALDAAERQKVEIRTYRIIYEITDEVKAAMKGLLAPKFTEVLLGHAQVRQTIRVPNVGTIAGSYITDGKITRASQIRVVRDGIVVFEDKISSLRRFKDDVREVVSGYECGIGLEKFTDIKENDVLEAFVMQEVEQ